MIDPGPAELRERLEVLRRATLDQYREVTQHIDPADADHMWLITPILDRIFVAAQRRVHEITAEYVLDAAIRALASDVPRDKDERE